MSNTVSEETKELIKRYFTAASNLYGIVSLRDIFKIYNKQNDPISENDFLEIVDDAQSHVNGYYIIGKDEMFSDVERTDPLDQDIVADYLVFEDEYDNYYDLIEEQIFQPMFIPEKDHFLRYENEFYHEKTMSYLSMRTFFRNLPGVSREQADELINTLTFLIRLYDDSFSDITIELYEEGLPGEALKCEDYYELFIRFYNDTRLNKLRGYTRNEIRKIFY